VVVGDRVADLGGVGLGECRRGRVNDWSGNRGGHWRCNRHWCGRNWNRGSHWHRHWGWRNDGCSVLDWSVVSDVRTEGVAVHVRGLADHLVADLLVADNCGSGLDCLEDGGWCGNGVDCGRLGHQSLAVHGGQGGHGGQSWHGGHCDGRRWRNCFGGGFFSGLERRRADTEGSGSGFPTKRMHRRQSHATACRSVRVVNDSTGQFRAARFAFQRNQLEQVAAGHRKPRRTPVRAGEVRSSTMRQTLTDCVGRGHGD
jgi:hypothetical protein